MKETLTHRFKQFFIQNAIASSLVFIILVVCLFDSTLLSIRNIRNILSDAAPIFLMSSGMALCLYSGYIDLSAGALASFAGIIAGSFVQRNDAAGRVIPFLPPMPAIIIVPLIVALFYVLGTFYGRFVWKRKIPSWFLTLALSSVIMGLGYMIVSSTNIGVSEITGFTNQFVQFGIGYIGSGPTYSLPLTVLIVFCALMGLWAYLRHHKLVFKSKVENLNERNTEANVKILFGCSTALFALAGILVTARNGVAAPTISFGLTSDAIAICLMAKFSLQGGKGKLRTTFITTLIYIALIYCLSYVGLSEYSSLVIRGIILICAILLELHIENKSKSVEADI